MNQLLPFLTASTTATLSATWTLADPLNFEIDVPINASVIDIEWAMEEEQEACQDAGCEFGCDYDFDTETATCRCGPDEIDNGSACVASPCLSLGCSHGCEIVDAATEEAECTRLVCKKLFNIKFYHF